MVKRKLLKKENQPKKLRYRMIKLLLLYWLLPLCILTTGMLYIISREFERKAADTIEESVDNAVEICEMRLKAAVNSSRKASYSTVIEDGWNLYQRDKDFRSLQKTIHKYLEENYRFEENFINTIVYFTEKPDDLFFTFSTGADKGYDSIRCFKDNVVEKVRETAEGIDTGIGFVTYGDRLYMVRNMMRSDYRPFAVIVMELNTDVIFQSLRGIVWYEADEVIIDEERVRSGGNRACLENIDEGMWKSIHGKSHYIKGRDGFYVYDTSKLEEHRMKYLVHLNRKAISYEKQASRFVVALLIVFSIPLVGMIYFSLNRTVTVPMNRLLEANREIVKGNFGYQLDMPEETEEFLYLRDAFNRMSDTLKNQFEQIYLEELAVRDANIKALQSQINPHFFNNTLEIINWEARMGDCETVSRMIEALSTMLEATMNRKKEQMIPLKEELGYVDAYFYIIKQRFGEKIQIEYQIAPEYMPIPVPRLIIQPIVENAVEHGLKGGNGKVVLRAHTEGDYLKIEVMNSRELTHTDRERIEKLLGGGKNESESITGSLGIDNVNRRLKIIYGPECGLSIESKEEGWTTSIITINRKRTVQNGGKV